MKSVYFVFVSTIFFAIIVQTKGNNCFNNVQYACFNQKKHSREVKIVSCNAQYGGIKSAEGEFNNYIVDHISRSYEYTMLGNHFAQYEKSRDGFAQLYNELSDAKWHKSIEMIKYMSKRGIKVQFTPEYDSVSFTDNYELDELKSLAKALDWEKEFAKKAFNIHQIVESRHKLDQDPGLTSYIEEEFVHQQADLIRTLSGHSNDLNNFLQKNETHSLVLSFFDDYLKH